MMPLCRLFCPTLSEGSIVVAAEESRHAIASLRAKPGHEIILFDGAGREAVGVISRIERRRLHVGVERITKHPFELSRKITLAVAMGRVHRQSYLVEKCTELGAAAIWPIITERSVTKPGGPAVDKWQRRAIEAAKQSGRSWVPQVAAPQPVAAILHRAGDFDASSVALPDLTSIPFSAFLAAQRAGSAVLVWVGPEGGWSSAERETLVRSGAIPTTLGPTVLRTETAAVAVCAAAAMLGSA
jgi:16S rRNA (uracil1498-N3)-methyltransferase